MPQQRIPVQLNQFIGGLNTEANPLGRPTNTTSDEVNVSLLKDGSRRRRLGFDVEDDFKGLATGVAYDNASLTGRAQFLWENPGGFASKQFMVVQLGNYVAVHDLDNSSVSDTPIYSVLFDTSTYSNNYSFAIADGALVIANGSPTVETIEYDGTDFTRVTSKLLVRDFFGVETTISSVKLTDPQNYSTRPATITSEHVYNLRNQTFAIPVMDDSGTDLRDMIAEFFAESGDTLYPSNADNTSIHVGPDANVAANRTIDRFRSEDMFKIKPNNTLAPRGHFIIDALSRGASRIEQEAKLVSENSTLSITVDNSTTNYPGYLALFEGVVANNKLPLDSTANGAKVLGQYAGRVWYAGFSATVTDGDAASPRMSSYVLFSQTVTDPSKVNKCYQEADPTDRNDSDLVDTDGGFIKLDGAYNIYSMVELQGSLFVFAENGVWQISGGSSDIFTATSYSVAKVSSEGCTGGASVVRFEQSIVYWSQAAMYYVSQNETGGWSINNMTRDTIQTIYDGISPEDKALSSGYYDIESDSFRWLYGNDLTGTSVTHELVYNTRFKSFTKNTIPVAANVLGPLTIAGSQRTTGNLSLGVEVQEIAVTVDGDEVTISRSSDIRSIRSSLYMIVLSQVPSLTYTFGGFQSEAPVDWDSIGAGVDDPAYLTSGAISGGDPRLDKEVPYLSTYFLRTEDEDFGDTESSCLVSSRWDWNTNVSNNKWSTPRQAYRPTKTTDGNDVIFTRNRIRGRGRVVSFHFESEEGKTFRLYGWQHNMSAGTEE